MTTANINDKSPNVFQKFTAKVGDSVNNLKEKTPDRSQVKESLTDQSVKMGDAYDQWRGRNYKELVQLLKEWAPDLEGNKIVAKELSQDTASFVAWLEDASDDDLRELIRQLYAFSQAQNLDLRWLMDPEMSKFAEKKLLQTMTEIVQLYCLTYWRSKAIQDEMDMLSRLQSWLADPTAKENADFNKELFNRLSAEGDIPQPPLELFLASEEERQAYTVKAIQEFIENDTETFYERLRTAPVVETEEIVVTEGEDDSEA